MSLHLKLSPSCIKKGSSFVINRSYHCYIQLKLNTTCRNWNWNFRCHLTPSFPTHWGAFGFLRNSELHAIPSYSAYWCSQFKTLLQSQQRPQLPMPLISELIVLNISYVRVNSAQRGSPQAQLIIFFQFFNYSHWILVTI